MVVDGGKKGVIPAARRLTQSLKLTVQMGLTRARKKAEQFHHRVEKQSQSRKKKDEVIVAAVSATVTTA